MSSLLPADRLFRVFGMDPEAQTGRDSALPAVSALSEEALRSSIATNIERCRHLGLQPAEVALERPGLYQAGSWLCESKISTKVDKTRWYLNLLGKNLKDEPYMIFVDEALVHVARPGRGRILSIRTKVPMTVQGHITVASRSGVLRHAEAGDFAAVSTDPAWLEAAAGRSKDLRAYIDAGMFVTKKASITRPMFSSEDKSATWLRAYEAVNDILRKEKSYDLYITHGTLLGCVRENKLIDNDDDFDCAYLSKHSNCDDVSLERFEIVQALQSHGIKCRFGTTGHIKVRHRGATIDLMPAWFDQGVYNVSGFTSVSLPLESILPLRRTSLLGAEVLVPACPEAFLRANYGEGWSTPDPFYRSAPNATAMKHRRKLVADQKAGPSP